MNATGCSYSRLKLKARLPADPTGLFSSAEQSVTFLAELLGGLAVMNLCLCQMCHTLCHVFHSNTHTHFHCSLQLSPWEDNVGQKNIST